MIDISKLCENDKGRSVLYKTQSVFEVGVLTSWNSSYVFVRFRGPNGEACRPEDVAFEFEENELVRS